MTPTGEQPYAAESMSEQNQKPPYAVRWAHGFYGDEVDFTTWHGVVSKGVTACGHKIPAPDSVMEFEVQAVAFTRCGQCKQCRDFKDAIKESA